MVVGSVVWKIHIVNITPDVGLKVRPLGILQTQCSLVPGPSVRPPTFTVVVTLTLVVVIKELEEVRFRTLVVTVIVEMVEVRFVTTVTRFEIE